MSSHNCEFCGACVEDTDQGFVSHCVHYMDMPGYAGECDYCGEWDGHLVQGLCHEHREKTRQPHPWHGREKRPSRVTDIQRRASARQRIHRFSAGDWPPEAA